MKKIIMALLLGLSACLAASPAAPRVQILNAFIDVSPNGATLEDAYGNTRNSGIPTSNIIAPVQGIYNVLGTGSWVQVPCTVTAGPATCIFHFPANSNFTWSVQEGTASATPVVAIGEASSTPGQDCVIVMGLSPGEVPWVTSGSATSVSGSATVHATK